MKKIIALFLVITFMGMNCATYKKGEGINLEAGQKPGAKLVIQKTDGQQVRGELIAVKQNSLVLMERDSGADVTVDVADIKIISIVKKSQAMLLGCTGFIPGAIFGLLYAEAWYSETGATNYAECILLFGAIATIPGALIGFLIGKDKTIQIEGKSEAEIKKILEDLRKKARVPDFQ